MFKKTIAISATLLTLSIAIPVLAKTDAGTASTTTSALVTAKISCVGAAVSVRETSLITGIGAYTKATSDAYSARASALQGAYGQTTLAAVKTAVKSVWSTFNSSMKTARKDWQTARNAAWAKYRTSVAACKAPTGTGDGTNSASETSGN